MTKITETFADSGETIEREASAEELSAIEIENKSYVKSKKLEADKAAAKASAQAKLAALGLTDDEVAAIVGN